MLQSHSWVHWYTYCVCWCDLDPIQGQGQPHGAFELPTIIEAVHAGGERWPQPPCGAFWFSSSFISAEVWSNHLLLSREVAQFLGDCYK